MSLFKRMVHGNRDLLEKLLEKMHQEGQLQIELEALLQDHPLTVDEQSRLKSDPIGYLLKNYPESGAISAEYTGVLGPLEPLLSDPKITEIRVSGANQIWVAAPLRKVELSFRDAAHLREVLEGIVQRAGKTLDAANPVMDFKTPEGYRITATIPPVSPTGAVFTIRKYLYASYLNMKDLIQMGTIHKEAMEFLYLCVKAGMNILITGEVLSGKTTLMAVLGNIVPNEDFIVVIDNDLDVGALSQEQVVHFLTQPLESDFSKVQLIHQAAAMHAQRLLVGDVDYDEINELIRAWIPWFATMRAMSVDDVLIKLDAITRDDALRALRLAEAVDLIVHMDRLRSGARMVGRISELRYVDGVLTAHDIYALKILNQKLEARLQFVNPPVGARFDTPEITAHLQKKI